MNQYTITPKGYVLCAGDDGIPALLPPREIMRRPMREHRIPPPHWPGLRIAERHWPGSFTALPQNGGCADWRLEFER